MASLFTHGFVAASAGLFPEFAKHRGWILLLGAFAAIVPDADVLAFRYGIAYDHPFGHRGATHSLAFALLLGALLTLPFLRAYPLRFRRRASAPPAAPGPVRESPAKSAAPRSTGGSGFVLFAYFFLCTLSHSLFDALTNGGLGVAFFFPFDNARYFFPDEWRVVQVSPIGARRFFSEWGLRVILSELKFIALPWAVALAGLYSLRFVWRRLVAIRRSDD